MEAKLVKREGDRFTYEVTVELKGSMLDMEDQIQGMVNDLGRAATRSALLDFDTNGEAIMVKGGKHTVKGRSKKKSSRPTGL